MENKYVVALSVVLVFVVGFFVYRHTKRQAAFEEDTTKQSTVMVAMAKTSPIGGLTQMASALKRYEQKNGRFPNTLDQLYPEFVGHRAFIDDIPWEYTAEAHQFLLKKGFTTKEGQMITSVDKSMRPQIQTALMDASNGGVSEEVASGEPKTDGSPQTPEPGKRALVGDKEKRSQALVKQPMSAQPVRMPEKETKHLSEPVPELFSIVGLEECMDLSLEVGQKHLVWKDKDGVIGFGNVEYPGVARMAILEDGKWVSVERARLLTPEPGEQAHAASQTPRTFFGVEVK